MGPSSRPKSTIYQIMCHKVNLHGGRGEGALRVHDMLSKHSSYPCETHALTCCLYEVWYGLLEHVWMHKQSH